MRKLVITLMVFFGLNACSLDEVILDTPAPSNFLTNQEGLHNLIGGMYGFLAQPQLYKGQTVLTMIESPTDYMITLQTGTKSAIGRRAFSTSQIEFNDAWIAYYKVIGNANQLIDVIENIVLAEGDYHQAKGQGHFLRAFCYFNLVRFFGGVPLFTDPTGSNTDFYKTRNSVDDVYQLIFEDFELAVSMLHSASEQPSSIANRATSGAAEAYLSLAYLTYGNYLAENGKDATQAFTSAKKHAQNVISSGEYALLDDFGDLWDVSKEEDAYREVIFGIHFTVDGVVSGKGSRGSELAHIFMPAGAQGVAGYNEWKQGFGHCMMQPWFYDFCTTGEYQGDYRAEKSFFTAFPTRANANLIRITYPTKSPSGPWGGFESAPYLGKYKSPQGMPNNDENDMFLIRLAEVYLILAEAENELNGPSALAYSSFNELRKRARNASGVQRTTPENLQTGLSKDAFRMKVFHERGVELMGEGHRWFDLVRMKAEDGRTMYEWMLDYVKQNYVAGNPTYDRVTDSWTNQRYNAAYIPAFNERHLLFPIPANQRVINPSMEQNPGW